LFGTLILVRYFQTGVEPTNMPALNTYAGNTEVGSITVPLTSCLTGLD
jgi:hypothetical protein